MFDRSEDSSLRACENELEVLSWFKLFELCGSLELGIGVVFVLLAAIGVLLTVLALEVLLLALSFSRLSAWTDSLLDTVLFSAKVSFLPGYFLAGGSFSGF